MRAGCGRAWRGRRRGAGGRRGRGGRSAAAAPCAVCGGGGQIWERRLYLVIDPRRAMYCSRGQGPAGRGRWAPTARAAASVPVFVASASATLTPGPPSCWTPPWRGALRCRGAEGVFPPGSVPGGRTWGGALRCQEAGSSTIAAGTKAGGSRPEAASESQQTAPGSVWIAQDRRRRLSIYPFGRDGMPLHGHGPSPDVFGRAVERGIIGLGSCRPWIDLDRPGPAGWVRGRAWIGVDRYASV